MKTKITLLALSLAASMTAQKTFRLENFETGSAITNGNSLYETVAASKTHSLFVDVVNTSSTTETFSVKRWDVLLNDNGTDEAIALFCFGENCYTSGVYEALSPVELPAGSRTSQLPAQPGIPNMLIAEITEVNPTGMSVVMYKVFNVEDTTDAITFSIRYNDPTAGIADASVTKPSLSLAPNPAHGATSALISLPVSGKCNVSVYDLLGSEVSSTSKTLPAGYSAVPLNLNNLRPGIYFVSFTTSAGSAVRRLVVN